MRCWRAALPLLILATVPTGIADDDKKPVELEIWVIRATKKNDKISPELKEIADRLKKELNYTGFKLEKKIPGKAELGKPFSTDLISSYKATVTPTTRSKKDIQFKVEVTQKTGKDKDKPVISATQTVELGKLLPVGGFDVEAGDKLIIAIRAR